MGRAPVRWLAPLAPLLLATKLAAGPLVPGELVVLDALADPLALGGYGAGFAVDRGQPPDANSRTAGSSTSFALLESVAALASGLALAADSEADPSGLGADANGGRGPGAVFRIDPGAVAVTLLSDGQNYRPGLPPPARTIFVDPTGIAVEASGRIVVADPDADPGGFGPDPNGFAGYGAILSVDAATGEVDLVADGSSYPAGLPPGEPSVFVDPVAVAVAADGRLLVLDIGADPLASGAVASVFRVDPATGEVTLLSSDPALRGPFDLAGEPTGHVLVADFLADPFARGDKGAVIRIDPAAPDPRANSTALVASSRTRSLAGIEATGSGHIFVVDSLADGLGLGRTGTVWEVDPATGVLTAVSSTTAYLSLVDVAAARSVAPAPTLLAVTPAFAAQGDTLTVSLSGTGFGTGASARFGPGIAVLAVRRVSATELSADLRVDLGAGVGTRDVVAGNPDLQGAALVAGFEVRGKPAPVVASIAPAAAAQGDALTVTVQGQFFDAGATVALGAGIVTGTTTRVSASELRADIRIAGSAPTGAHDVVVTNGDLRTGTLAGGFLVTPPRAPMVGAVVPSSAPPGPLALTLTGGDFRPGASVALGAGIRVTRVEWRSQSELQVRASAPFGAAPGARDVTVTNPDLQAGTLPAGFTLSSRTRLARVALRPDDTSAGNGDLRLDPGETVDLVLRVGNRGNVLAQGVEARLALRAPIPGVSVPVGFVSFPDAAPGAVVARPAAPQLQIALAPTLPCGAALPLRLELSDRSGSLTIDDLTLRVGHPAGLTLKPELDGGAGDRMGGAVAGAGDVDGDGAEDLLIASPLDDPGGVTDAGSVLVVSGATGAIRVRHAGATPGGRRGSALAGGVDLDSDGVPDLALGAPGEGGGGRAVVLSGATGGELLASSGALAGDRAGEAVALGDFDGDGVGDLALGVPGADRVELWSGLTGALAATLTGAAGSEFGAALAASDLDGDGWSDVLVGAPSADGGAGRIEGLSLAAGAIVVRAGVAGEALGTSISDAGDLDGDGRGDVLAGAPGFDPGGLAQAGRAVVVSGAGAGLLAAAVGVEPGSALGTRVAGGRDADLDGVADYAASAPGAGGGGADAAGRVDLSSGLTGLALAVQDGTLARENAGAGGLALVDRLGDGTLDVLVGSPRAAPGLQIDAGAGYALTTDIGCTSFTPCADDAFEDDDTWARASAIALGTRGGLALCPADEDWLRFDIPAGGERVLSVSFDAALTDLDLYAYDPFGDLVAVAAGVTSPESVRVTAVAAGTYRVRVVGPGGSSGSYAATLRDGAACDPTMVPTGLAAVKAPGGQVRLSWDPSTDPCHEPSLTKVGYRVWAASTARPATSPSFPSDPPFADLSASDVDGSSADPTFTGPAPGAALTVFVVVDVGTSGSSGPAGHY